MDVEAPTVIYDLFGDPIVVKPLMSRDRLKELLKAILTPLSLDQVVRLMTNEFNEMIEYTKLKDDEKACQKTSLLFNPHRLNVRSGSSTLSIYEALKSESFLDGLSRCVIFRDSEDVKTYDLLYFALQMGINGVQLCNEFPPHVARKLCKQYDLGAESQVLDPCAGWGGRMIGVSTVCNRYTCFDPSTATFNGLSRLKEYLKHLDGDFDATIVHSPFEDSNLPDNSFDFAFTSPPYFDIEKYSDEETNSLNRYREFDTWVRRFFHPLIDKTMKALKPGKTFVLNIGSRRYPLSETLTNYCEKRFQIQKLGSYLVNNGGLGRTGGEGETFYALTKN